MESGEHNGPSARRPAMPGPPAKRRRKQRQNAGRQVLARKEDGNEPLMVAVKQENPEFDRSSSAEEAAEESGQPDQEVVSARVEAEKRCREELQKRLKAEEEELRRRQINPPERTPVVVPARIQVPSLLSEVERRARAELQARLKEEERLIQEERAKAQLQARLQAEAAQAQAKAMAEAQKAQAEAAKARAKAETEAQARARAAEEARQKAKSEAEASAARAKAKAKLEQQRAAAKAKVVARPEQEVKAKAKAATPAAGASRAPPPAQAEDALVAVKKETSRSPSPGQEASKAGRPRKAEEKMPPQHVEEKSRPAPTKQKPVPVAARGPRPEGVKASASKAKATPPLQQGSKAKPGVSASRKNGGPANVSRDRSLAALCAPLLASNIEALSVAWPLRQEEQRVCSKLREGETGVLLPLFKDEWSWNLDLRRVLYFLGLGYLFCGVGVVSDIFMSSIEEITAKTTKKMNPTTGDFVRVKVWNATVANLTLMALGSSAPEILLSIIELVGNRMYSGELGPSTIVGSAAFNLLCIIAVCICAIPAGEVRKIKEVPVFVVTTCFSIFAYLWLLMILLVTSPNVVEIWEGVFTFLFFWILIAIAYMADRGYFGCRSAEDEEDEEAQQYRSRVISAELSAEDLAKIQSHLLQVHGHHLTDEELIKLIEAEQKAETPRTKDPTGANMRKVAPMDAEEAPAAKIAGQGDNVTPPKALDLSWSVEGGLLGLAAGVFSRTEEWSLQGARKWEEGVGAQLQLFSIPAASPGASMKPQGAPVATCYAANDGVENTKLRASPRWKKQMDLWKFELEILEEKWGVKVWRQLDGSLVIKGHMESFSDCVVHMEHAMKELEKQGVKVHEIAGGYVMFRHANLWDVQENDAYIYIGEDDLEKIYEEENDMVPGAVLSDTGPEHAEMLLTTEDVPRQRGIVDIAAQGGLVGKAALLQLTAYVEEDMADAPMADDLVEDDLPDVETLVKRTEFRGQFADVQRELSFDAARSPWQAGKTERAGAHYKRVYDKAIDSTFASSWGEI
ncbi:Slc8a1 [Symbiodinium sp. CCMP2592]|nr:Slc8a1 [Symbiodinium sp. CCMP2592]